jgi:hypothetical protein
MTAAATTRPVMTATEVTVIMAATATATAAAMERQWQQ